MPVLEPYLFFNGNCSEAMHFYARTLGGKIEFEQKFKGSPGCEDMSPDMAEQTMHILMSLGDRKLMASDTGGKPHQGHQGFSLSLAYTDLAEARRHFDALAAGGKVVMPLGETFWAEAFGMLEDKYGVAWMINAGTKPM